jgi:hypothetical protein
MSTYTGLKKDYSSYINSESKNWDNIVTPGRKAAAQEYIQKLNKFVDDAVKEEDKNIKSDLDLLATRQKNEENKNIYPLVNYDFDYKTAIKKEYNPFKLGITNNPSFSSFIDGTAKLSKYAKGLITDEFPNNKTVAGVTDTVTENKNRKYIVDATRLMDNKLPYPSFRKDYPECTYPTTGRHSSSYFVNVGKCPTRITDKDICINKGYSWIPEKESPEAMKGYVKENDTRGTVNTEGAGIKPPPLPPKGNCYKPRFLYVDNSAKGIFNNAGAVPAMFNEIGSVMPDKLYDIMSGYAISGSGIVPCSTEEFTNIGYDVKGITSVVLLTILLAVSIYVVRK